jgi:hypothetical protein
MTPDRDAARELAEQYAARSAQLKAIAPLAQE